MVDVSDGFIEYLAENSGAAHVELRTPEREGALVALTAARDALFKVRHPEEPTDPLASFATDVEPTERGATFWFDAADAEVYDGLLEHVVAVMREAIDAHGVSGTLTWPDGP